MAAISPARAAAFAALGKVYAGSHADDVLHSPLLTPLDERDRALATTLVMGVLRWQLALDAAIVPKLNAARRTPVEVMLAIRLGLFQLWFLDRVPSHAAVAESVALSKRSAGDASGPVVNAVLRGLQRAQLPQPSALQAQTPWMMERWRTFYDDDRAKQIAAGSQREPERIYRVASGHAEQSPPGQFLTHAPTSTDSPDTPARIQDEGSQLVGEIAASAGAGANAVWDTCAAPGGKTAVLAEMLPSANILATDVSASRLQTMQRLLAPLAFANVKMQVADAARPEPQLRERFFDLVLCDAPCSGTGTLARNPEIRLRLQPPALKRHAERQLAILTSAWQQLRAGGTLVYSTCSLEPEENVQVIAQFAKSATNAITISATDVIEAMRGAGRLTVAGARTLQSSALNGPYLQTLPGVHSCDGFFAAILRKRA